MLLYKNLIKLGSSFKTGRFADAPSRIGSAVGSNIGSVTQEQLLRDLANSETKVKSLKKSQNIKRAQSMKSTKSIISSKTVDCGVGTSPPMARKIESFDSGVGLVQAQSCKFSERTQHSLIKLSSAQVNKAQLNSAQLSST